MLQRWCRGGKGCCVGGAEVMWGWCGGGAGVVQGWSGSVWVGLGVTVTVIDVKWVTHALCSDVLNELFEFPSKIRLYQRVTFICLWVISQ